MKQHLRFYILVGLCFILAGGLLASPYLIKRWQQKAAKPAFNVSKVRTVAKPATISGQPTHIEIPSLGISVDIQPGYYNKESQTWTLSNTKAQYATITPAANNGGGNTFVYGHNRPEVFSKLLNIKSGEEAIVTTDNKHRFTYKMTGQKVTKPTDDSLFHYEGKPILTLQTCSGLWYQNRSLFVFDLVKVS